MAGNIYIFGSDQRFDESVPPSAEVLDPLTGWVEMVSEGYDDNYSLAGVDCVLKRIVFLAYINDHDTETEVSLVFFYSLVVKVWTRESHPKLGHNILQLSTYYARVLVSSTIYWFSGLMKAYDCEQVILFHDSQRSPGLP